MDIGLLGDMYILLVILLVKKGYGLVSAWSQPYRTRPEAEFDTAGWTQIPGRIPFLQGG